MFLKANTYKKFPGSMALFYFFANFFTMWLNKRQLDTHPASVFSLLQYPKSYCL